MIKNKKIEFEVENLIFTAKGLEIKKKGWMDVYKARLQEAELKDLNGENYAEPYWDIIKHEKKSLSRKD